MYSSYPFIEFKLDIVNKTQINYYKFNVSEIYFQTAPITSNKPSIKLTNINGSSFFKTFNPNFDVNFSSNYCLLNSPTKLYFSNNIIKYQAVLKNTFWWRLDQTEGTANIFYYNPVYKQTDYKTNSTLSAEIKHYYNVCTTKQTFSGEFSCL